MTLVRQEETRSKTGTGSSWPAANIGYWNGSPKHILSMTINMVGGDWLCFGGKKVCCFCTNGVHMYGLSYGVLWKKILTVKPHSQELRVAYSYYVALYNYFLICTIHR